MDILRRIFFKRLLPPALLTLICSGRATAIYGAGIENDQTPKNCKDNPGRVFYVSDYGVKIDNSAAENSQNLQKMLDDLSGKSVITRIVFTDAGTLWINGPIVIPDNTDIEIKAGITVSGAVGNVKPLFVSEYWSYVLANRSLSQGFAVNGSDTALRSDYIGLWGNGAVDYNYSGGVAANGLDMSCICIVSAKRVKLGGGLLVGGAMKYAYLVANVDFLDAQTLRFNNKSDGLHLQPPVDYAYVRNLSGSTGDDMFALTGGDYADYDLGLRGAFNHIDVEGIHGDNALCAVKVAGNRSTPVNLLSVNGIYGSFNTSIIRIWTDSQHLNYTDVKTCTIDNLAASPGAGYRSIEVKTVGTGTVNIDSLSIATLSGNYATARVPVISVTTGTAGNSAVKVGNLSCRCPRHVSHFIEIGGDGAGADTSRVDNLSVYFEETHFAQHIADAWGVKVTRGQVSNMVIGGVVTLIAGQSVLLKTGGKISTVTFDNLKQNNGYSCYAKGRNFDTSLPYFQFVAGFYTSPDRLVQLETGFSVDLAGPVVNSKVDEVFSALSGTVHLAGHIAYENSCIPSAPAKGVIWSIKGFGIFADVANAATTRGLHCYNTNRLLAGGTGPAVANGSEWSSLI